MKDDEIKVVGTMFLMVVFFGVVVGMCVQMRLQIAIGISLSAMIICLGYFWVWLIVSLLSAIFIPLFRCNKLSEVCCNEIRYGCPPDYYGYVVGDNLDE